MANAFHALREHNGTGLVVNKIMVRGTLGQFIDFFLKLLQLALDINEK